MSIENLVWEQKYRPKKIKDVILPESTTKLLTEQIASGKLSNLLFSGSPGTGKTTAAYAIASELDADVLFINASLEGNMDMLRTKLVQFASAVSFSGSKKIIILDEGDYMTPLVQPALRGIVDEFSSNCTFIFTCNYPERIIQPLQSRLTKIDFKFPKTEIPKAMGSMLKNVCGILDKETVKYDKKVIASVITKNFPDFRKTIGELQRYSAGGEIDSGILAITDNSGIDDLIVALKEKNFTKCRQWVANNSTDAQSFYRMFYDKISPMIVTQAVPQLILHIAEYQYRASYTVDQEINSMAFLINVLKDCPMK